MEEKYSLEQIREAFWEVFHKSGELWFGYLGTDDENEKYTEVWWIDLKRAIRRPEKK